MSGTGKRAHAADSSDAGKEQAPANKKQRTDSANWCFDCWGPMRDACRGSHRLLDRIEAEKELQEQFTAARMEMAKLQKRLDALSGARIQEGPVLIACVPSRDGHDDGWRVPGGDIRITLAPQQSLTKQDKTKIWGVLEGLKIDYDVDGTASVMAYGDVGSALDGLMDKFPDLVVGQAVRNGDVLLNAKSLEVYFKGTQVKVPGSKHFGSVDDEGMEALEGEGCDGTFDGRYNTCWSREEDCFCNYGGPRTIALSDVCFEGDSEDENEEECEEEENEEEGEEETDEENEEDNEEENDEVNREESKK